MARPLRLELAGGLYHVTSRGDRREDIYVDDDDREEWLSLLGRVCNRFNWRCHVYCLMDNHYHIVIETAEANLSKGMRQLNGVYTQYYNRRHNRVGHVFQGQFSKQRKRAINHYINFVREGAPCVRLVVLLQMKIHTSSLKCVVCLLAIIGFFIVLMAAKLKYYM